jgi:hypothetical protein
MTRLVFQQLTEKRTKGFSLREWSISDLQSETSLVNIYNSSPVKCIIALIRKLSWGLKSRLNGDQKLTTKIFRTSQSSTGLVGRIQVQNKKIFL